MNGRMTVYNCFAALLGPNLLTGVSISSWKPPLVSVSVIAATRLDWDAEDAGVNPRKVGEVGEVLDHARSVGAPLASEV